MKKGFGLYFGEDTLQAALIKAGGKKPDQLLLAAIDEVANPVRQLEAWQQTNELLGAIRQLLAETAIEEKEVIVGLPETLVVSRTVTLPPMKETEIAAALRYEAETFIPYPIQETQMDYQVISRDENGRQHVFVVATRKIFLQQLTDFLDKLGLMPLAVENYSLALNRSLCPKRSAPTIVADIGEQTTTLLVSVNGNVYLARPIALGGQAFTRAVSVSLGMDIAKAEEFKRVYGLTKGKWQNKIRQALLPLVNQFSAEVRKTSLAFAEEWRQKPDLLILSGAGSLIAHFSDVLVEQLGLEVQWGEPLRNLTIAPDHVFPQLKEQQLRFSGVIGLALRPWR